MLLTDVPPCKNYTAGIVLNILCGFLLEAGHDVCCFAVQSEAIENSAEIPEDKKSLIPFASARMPKENWGHASPHFLSSYIRNNLAAILELPPIARKAVAFAKSNDVDLIWSVVQGQSTIKLTERIAKSSGLEYVVQVWDPPNWWLRDNRFDEKTTKYVLNAFGRIIRNSKCCIAASWVMAETYTERYGCPKSIPVILGFDPERVQPKREKNPHRFTIVFSGQMYASNELQSLIYALDILGWQFEGKEIVLRCYGRAFQLFFSHSARVEVCGWLPYDDLVTELAEADLLYCPYWFDPVFEEEASLSFPSKLTTYFKTGVPVLFHGPDYASPRKFIAETGSAYICGTLYPPGIVEVLQYIMTDTNRHAVGEQGFYTFSQRLTLENMRSNFFEALGI